MCDTMIALGGLTQSGRVTFAKNSDREPNEAQYLTQVAAADHAPGSMVRCTYVEIPQVSHTYAVIGSRPWWIWGFEHGLNEKGVVIGNEAVWSRLPASQEPGLLGMDILRLTLERAASADEGLEVLTRLLETHGQGGNASFAGKSFYHNSFIIADSDGGWVVQTAGRHWVAKRISGWASISNVYSIGSDYDRISAGAVRFATEQGWYDPAANEPFDFAAVYADLTIPIIRHCQNRFRLSQTGMGGLARQGSISLQQIFGLLRTHGENDANPAWRPGTDGAGYLCMHATDPARFETAASMVVELPRKGTDDEIRCWVSLASPCLSAFVPFWFADGVPLGYAQPAPGSRDLWWNQERLQRLIERDYAVYAPMARTIFAALEREAVDRVAAMGDRTPCGERKQLSQEIADRLASAVEMLQQSVSELAEGPVPPRGDDPRGSYLDVVNGLMPDTTTAASTPKDRSAQEPVVSQA